VVFCYGDYFTFSPGKMEPKKGVSADNAWVVVDITIGAADSGAAGVAPAGSASAPAATQESPPGVWLPFLAIGLLLALRRI